MKLANRKFTFFVPGKPAPGGSKRGFYNKKTNRVIMAPASNKTKPWMATVSAVVRSEYNGKLLTGAIVLTLQFQLLRPKKHYGTGKNKNTLTAIAPYYVAVRPDATKLTRGTEDALSGVIFRDDAQVVIQHISCVYVEKNPGVQITVEEIDNVWYKS